MPVFAKNIRFNDGEQPTIDGVEFPWRLSDEGVHLDFEPGMSTLCLPVLVKVPLTVFTTHSIGGIPCPNSRPSPSPSRPSPAPPASRGRLERQRRRRMHDMATQGHRHPAGLGHPTWQAIRGRTGRS